MLWVTRISVKNISDTHGRLKFGGFEPKMQQITEQELVLKTLFKLPDSRLPVEDGQYRLPVFGNAIIASNASSMPF
jgi:hypothetical protein